MIWLRAALIRMVRTGAQAALGAIGAAAVLSEIKWDVVGGATAIAMLISMLMSLAGLPESPEPSPLQRAEGEGGQSVLVMVGIAVVVCFLLLLAFNIIDVRGN